MVKYTAVGRIFHQAGLDPRTAFEKAEAEIKKANLTEMFDPECMVDLARGFVDTELIQDALKMADAKIKTRTPARTGYRERKRVDDSGFNAEGLFRKTFVWVEQFAAIEPDGLWQASARDRKALAITEAAKRGYFVLAREQIDQFSPDHGWPKAEIVAELARVEAQQAGVL